MRALPLTLTVRVTDTFDRARTWLRDHVASVAARFRRTRRAEGGALAPVMLDPVPFADDPEGAAWDAIPDPTARDLAMDFLGNCGYRGNWNTRTRRAFFDLAEANYWRAEGDIPGAALLNPEGLRQGIDPWDLVIGTDRLAQRYASEELRAWWNDNGGRITIAEYRADLENGSGDRVRSERDAFA